MFLALLAFAAGIALGHYTWRPPTWWLIAAVAHAAAAIRFLRMRAHFALALTLAAFVFAGAAVGALTAAFTSRRERTA